MSYLDVPRIHFGGLFFTNPDTINNSVRNYNPAVPLTDAQGAYLPQAGWNAVGVAQLWLSECTVLSVVGPSGDLLSAAAADPVIGAAVESPSPATPKKTPDGKGFYDIAKMVDLDPYQQGRSAVYGLRIWVTLPGGGGFSGLVSIPELQYLDGRVPVQTGSWSAVGIWMGQIPEVDWFGDLSASPFLAEFRAACSRGVAVKITMDLHQNNPATRLTPGNLFCYGRVMGSLGPLLAGELAQVVPGRQIVPPPPASEAVTTEALESAAPGTFTPRTIDERFRSAAGSASATLEALPAAEAEIPPFNPAAARVSGSLLHVDLGASLQVQGTLENNVGVSDGKFTLDTGISIGVLDSSGAVRPLQHGQVSFADQYQLLDSQSKQVNLVKNSGLVDVPLEPDEVSLVASNPLAVAVGNATVLQEPASGYLLGVETFSARLVPGASSTLRLMARKFGRPVVEAQPATWQIYNASTGQPSTEIAIAWGGSTDANGLAALTVSTPGGDVTLPPARQPLDSQVYFVFFFDPDGQLLGDGYGEAPGGNNVTFTVLRFQSYTVPAEPDWEQDVGPVLEAYARLYPGMKERLDIGDEATVRSFAPALYGRMSLPVQDPAYMPVTRDLSPAKVEMILQWLKAQQGS